MLSRLSETEQSEVRRLSATLKVCGAERCERCKGIGLTLLDSTVAHLIRFFVLGPTDFVYCKNCFGLGVDVSKAKDMLTKIPDGHARWVLRAIDKVRFTL